MHRRKCNGWVDKNDGEIELKEKKNNKKIGSRSNGNKTHKNDV